MHGYVHSVTSMHYVQGADSADHSEAYFALLLHLLHTHTTVSFLYPVKNLFLFKPSSQPVTPNLVVIF